MDLQDSVLGEGFPAFVARVWSLPRVAEAVPVQMCRRQERLVAHLTYIPAWWLMFRLFVLGKFRALDEGQIAHLAFERLAPRMGSFVRDEVA